MIKMSLTFYGRLLLSKEEIIARCRDAEISKSRAIKTTGKMAKNTLNHLMDDTDYALSLNYDFNYPHNSNGNYYYPKVKTETAGFMPVLIW